MAKKYKITVESNPSFCGIDAGGVQFANGEAVIDECPLVSWFEEHDGYAVEAVEEKAIEEKAVETATKKGATKKAAE